VNKSEVKKKTINKTIICGSKMFERIPTLKDNENAIVKKRDKDLQITIRETIVKEKNNKVVYITILYFNYKFINYYD
jgi:dihydrofolate reductase